jgi:hypothetical protein
MTTCRSLKWSTSECRVMGPGVVLLSCREGSSGLQGRSQQLLLRLGPAQSHEGANALCGQENCWCCCVSNMCEAADCGLTAAIHTITTPT